MQLAIHEAGPQDGPMIVFLHGGGLSGRMWQPQFERLREFHCVAPDFPEHGQSANVGPLTLDGVTEQVAALIRERAPHGKAHVVGLSFGGVVAQQLLTRRPEVVDHAVISGTSMRLGRGLVAIQNLNVPVLRMLNAKQRVALMAAQFSIPAEYRTLLYEDMARFSATAFAHLNQTYLEIEVPMAEVPTLVAVGEKETFLAKRMARQLAAALPNATGVMVPRVGHVWNLQAPDLFAEVVRAWVVDRALPEGLQALSE